MNRLEIQKYEEQIAVLSAKIDRLVAADRAKFTPSLYTCTRCGLLYQSPWGCGCPVPAVKPLDGSSQGDAA